MTKKQIVKDWLVRYTGLELDKFGDYILLTNFKKYVEMFAQREKCAIYGNDKPMQVATSQDGISIINFGIGSPNAALIMDLLTAIMPKGVLFLGKTGSLKKKIKVGDLILPIAAIRDEGTSNDYADSKVPALPSFQMLRSVSEVIMRHNQDYFTGIAYTTNRRVWEHDEIFKKHLKQVRATCIDMETATLFLTGFMNEIPRGALLLVSDEPMTPEGIKTSESDKLVSIKFLDMHLAIGIESLREIQNSGSSLKHLRFDRDVETEDAGELDFDTEL